MRPDHYRVVAILTNNYYCDVRLADAASFISDQHNAHVQINDFNLSQNNYVGKQLQSHREIHSQGITTKCIIELMTKVNEFNSDGDCDIPKM